MGLEECRRAGAERVGDARQKQVMLITKRPNSKVLGGRELLCKLNHDILKDIYQEKLLVFELRKTSLQNVSSKLSAFRGHIDGIDAAVLSEVVGAIQNADVASVFVDGSNLGEIVRALKRAMPHLQVTTFFHNVEARFFLGSFRLNKSARAFGILLANYLAERKAVRHSDNIISLCHRDSRLLHRIYGRSATHISPIALKDHSDTVREYSGTVQRDFLLFVGGGFYGNLDGISRFIHSVAPHIDCDVCIVGHGMEKLRSQSGVPRNVEVVGAVESLVPWYTAAHFVIAPVFDGSGMKTKVAEALMHGKRIVGTPEAFTGYEEVVSDIGWVCSTPEDFVKTIRRAKREVLLAFDPMLRRVYEERYSFSAARARFVAILGK